MDLKKTYLYTFYILLIVVLFSAGLLLNGCTDKAKTGYTLTGNIVVDGKNLAEINCTKCHALVPIDALNKNVWKFHTLPAMAHRLGISHYLDGYYKSEKDTGGLSLAEWQSIVAYYEKMAPDTLLAAKKPSPLLSDWAEFTLKKPAPFKYPAFTTLASVNPNTHKIYTSDAMHDDLLEWDSNFKMRKVANLPSMAVNALFTKDASGNNTGIFSCIGKLDPVDFPNGRALRFNLGASTDSTNQKLIADDLARPVQTLEADFNKDGLNDLVILGQGHLKGGVYLFTQSKDHSYTQSNITEKPGAVQAVSGDFNNDGYQDLMILFGSGDEGLWLFTNNQKGGFTSKNLLRFPPVYGSTSFQLADLDHDGKPDLIYTSGYNFNDSRILKPYHGLYIFKNAGDWNFKQQWFYPINGCTKAIAADFAGNGKLDIATSAFYADMQTTPAEEFIYFEQVSPFNYKAHAIPVSQNGRWDAMDVGDYNGDGKPDIILGNFAKGFMFQPIKPFWDQSLPFIVLENNIKSGKQ